MIETVVTFLWPSPAMLTEESVNLDSASMVPLTPWPVKDKRHGAAGLADHRVGGDRVTGPRQRLGVEARHLGRVTWSKKTMAPRSLATFSATFALAGIGKLPNSPLTLIVRLAMAGAAWLTEAEDEAEAEARTCSAKPRRVPFRACRDCVAGRRHRARS
jgi:hypothetical protein